MSEDTALSGAVADSSLEPSAPQIDSTPTNGREPLPATGSDANSSSPEAKNEQQRHKRLSPYERVKRQRAEIRQREAALKQREDQIAEAERQRERQREEEKKPKYTLADLKEYRQAWENEGNFELVSRADKEIARLEKLEADKIAAEKQTVELPRYGTKEHQARWEAAELAIQKEDPDFMKEGSPLDLMIRRIMQSPYGQAARDHPDGIWAVYAEAQKELLKEENQSLRGRVQQLESQVKAYGGLTSLSGGAPGRIGSGNRVETLNDFKRLSSADMRKHLLLAGKHERPWL